jgi:hypothetical protein
MELWEPSWKPAGRALVILLLHKVMLASSGNPPWLPRCYTKGLVSLSDSRFCGPIPANGMQDFFFTTPSCPGAALWGLGSR